MKESQSAEVLNYGKELDVLVTIERRHVIIHTKAYPPVDTPNDSTCTACGELMGDSVYVMGLEGTTYIRFHPECLPGWEEYQLTSDELRERYIERLHEEAA